MDGAKQTPKTPVTPDEGLDTPTATPASGAAEIPSTLLECAVVKPPAAGMGRLKGVPNRVSADMKAMVTQFVEDNIGGAQALYERVAVRSPARALSLLAKFAGLVLPRQSQHGGSPLVQVNIGNELKLTPEQAYRAICSDPAANIEDIMMRVIDSETVT